MDFKDTHCGLKGYFVALRLRIKVPVICDILTGTAGCLTSSKQWCVFFQSFWSKSDICMEVWIAKYRFGQQNILQRLVKTIVCVCVEYAVGKFNIKTITVLNVRKLFLR